ncbi:uncharacterized protein [Oscarella lobularis]|uniref:uncharacterized protein isoform X2 n=1 Tax=Oscarella lobularis TaxID=121494 RepID=UPI0033135EF3
MFGATIAVVSVEVFALLLDLFSSLTHGKLTSYMNVHGRHKYFILENATSPDFLECGGAYDNGEKGLAIHLMLYRDPDHQTPTVTMTKSGSIPVWPHQREYTYSCSDDRLANGGGAPISSGFCKFGVTRVGVSVEFSGRYDCLVQSAGTRAGTSEASSPGSVLLEVYDGSQSQDPSSGIVDEGFQLSFSCGFNRQADISLLTIQWRRNGVSVYEKALSDLTTPFVYKIQKASPADAGLYECVVVSRSDGDYVIDTLKAENPVVVNHNYAPRVVFFSSPFSEIHQKKKMPEVNVPQGETFLLNCNVSAFPFATVNKQKMKKEHVSITTTFHDATREDSGVHCCEAVNKMGRVSRYIEVLVYVAAKITFFGVHGNENACLLQGTEALLQCNAVGSSFLTVWIVNPNGTVVRESREYDNAEVAYPLPTATLTKEETFVCHMRSTRDEEITKEYKFCVRPDSFGTTIIESAAGGGGGLLILFVFVVALIACCRKRRRDTNQSNPDSLIPSRPKTDDQIEIIAQIICYDWIDVLRGIEPSFEDGDSFLRSVKTGERRGGEADSVIFCLKKWIEQNPRDACNLLSAVCSAAEAADRKDLAEKLAAKFQNFPNMLDNTGR